METLQYHLFFSLNLLCLQDRDWLRIILDQDVSTDIQRLDIVEISVFFVLKRVSLFSPDT